VGVRLIKVYVIGGGGGGGGSNGASNYGAGGSGGGGGGTAIKLIDVAVIDSVAVTVGAGGAGGSGTGDGDTGGTSSFGSHCSATGGEGGVKGNPSTTHGVFTYGTAGGIGSGGTINMEGLHRDSNSQPAWIPHPRLLIRSGRYFECRCAGGPGTGGKGEGGSERRETGHGSWRLNRTNAGD